MKATGKRYREQSRARTEASRAAVIASGGSYLSIMLGSEATDALERVTSAGMTKRAAIEAAIIKMDREKKQ